MRLCYYLKAKSETQQQFAARLGCDQSTVSRYCDGRVPEPAIQKKIYELTAGAVTPNDFADIEAAPATEPAEAAA